MKTTPKWKQIWLAMLFLTSIALPSMAQQGTTSFQMFYDELSPYGSWILHPSHGDVWRPNVEGEFTPYLTNGYWTVTDHGNTWVSNYEWGWAPFHYGRWFFDDFEGWVWIPGETWAPAWVAWRNSGDYYGWAPLGPGMSFSMSFNFGLIPHFYWSFVPYRYVWHRSVFSFCAPRARNVYYVDNSVHITNYYEINNYNFYSGPSHRDIVRVTNRPVHIQRIETCDRPGRQVIDRDRIVVYRPRFERTDNDKPRPTKGNNGLHLGWEKGKGNNGIPGNGGNNGGGNGTPGNGQGNGQGENGNPGHNNNGNGNPRGGDGNQGNGNFGRSSGDYRSNRFHAEEPRESIEMPTREKLERKEDAVFNRQRPEKRENSSANHDFRSERRRQPTLERRPAIKPSMPSPPRESGGNSRTKSTAPTKSFGGNNRSELMRSSKSLSSQRTKAQESGRSSSGSRKKD